MHQLQFMKQDIIDKTNKILGREMIKDIHFSIAVISPSTPKNGGKFIFPDQYPFNERDRKIIEKSSASVSDKELGNILKRVMTKEIIRRRMRENLKSPRK